MTVQLVYNIGENSIAQWMTDNLNWFIPMIITAIFSALNIRMASINLKTSKNQLKLQNDAFCYQLYDRRMEIYTSIQKVIAAILRDGTVSVELLQEYARCTRDVVFLFGNDMEDKVMQLYRMMAELRKVSAKVKHHIQTQQTSPDYSELCEREDTLLKQIQDKGEALKIDFAPYISFHEYRVATKEVRE